MALQFALCSVQNAQCAECGVQKVHSAHCVVCSVQSLYTVRSGSLQKLVDLLPV